MMKIQDSLLLLAEILWITLKILYYICEDIYKSLVPVKKKDVAGEIVLITGAGHGIGKELAIGYASLGATVVCWDINKETNEETMNEIKKMGISCVYAYKCDVSNREEVLKVAEEVKKEVGIVTILINNTGIVRIKKFLDHSIDDIRQVIDVNLMGQFWTLQAFLPSMIKMNYGHVVALSSIAGHIGSIHGTVYCASKSAIKIFMEALSEEFRTYYEGKSLIKFTTIYPTLVFTGLVKKIRMRFPNFVAGISPQKAASLIIDAQRRNIKEKILPSYCFPILNLLRFLPEKAINCIRDLLDIYCEA